MTDKQQPPEVPERITAGLCSKCGAVVAGLNACPYCGTDWIGTRVEYARVHRVDDARVEEVIRSAAVRKNGVVYVCWAHTYLELKRMNHDAPADVLKRSEQGFVTNTGRFVNREEAFVIARAAGQIKHKHGEASTLYSEDLREPISSSEPVSLKDGGAAICPQCGYDPAKWVTIGTVKVDIENETETFIPTAVPTESSVHEHDYYNDGDMLSCYGCTSVKTIDKN